MKRTMTLQALLLTIAMAAPAWGQTPTPNTWTRYPGTTFNAWANASGLKALHEQCHASTGVEGILIAWSGMIYHPPLDALVNVRGGGHADGCFNGGLALRLGTTPPSWTLLTQPSPREVRDAQGTIVTPGFNPMTSAFPNVEDHPNPYSGQMHIPSSVHGYGNLAAITTGPDAGKVITSGGIFWSRAGRSSPPHTWLYDPTKPTADTAYEYIGIRLGGYGVQSMWDHVGHRALFRVGKYFLQWTRAGGWQTLYTQSGSASSTLGYDAANQRIYYLTSGALRTINLNNLGGKDQPLTTAGSLGKIPSPGLVFDSGRLVVFGFGETTGTGAIWTLHLDGFNICGGANQPPCMTWERTTPADDIHPPRPTQQGTWGRFSRRGCDFWLVAGANVDVYSYRPSWTLETCTTAPTTATPTIQTVGSGLGTPPRPAGDSRHALGAAVSLGKR